MGNGVNQERRKSETSETSTSAK